MGFMRAASMLLVVVIATALLSGGALHIAIPHDHGGHTHAEESPQWSALHASLRHEDKKDLLLLWLIALGMFALAPQRLLVRFEVLDQAMPGIPFLLEELRRGIALYRRFG